MSIYFSNKFGGPCWSRTLGYHTPTPMPAHIMRIITSPPPAKEQKAKPRKKRTTTHKPGSATGRESK